MKMDSLLLLKNIATSNPLEPQQTYIKLISGTEANYNNFQKIHV